MAENVHGTFVSHKVSKVRWRPEDFEESELFVTGSVDEDENHITLWYYPLNQDNAENFPRKEKTLVQKGDVTELKFLNKTMFAVSSSLGSVRLVQCDILCDLSEVSSWEGLHYFKSGELSSCCSLACFEEDIATVGEDGRICLLTVSQPKPIRTIDFANSCSLTCVCFLKHNELLTGDLRGQMKIWDLRSAEDAPMSTFMLSGDQISVPCITHHPTQKHLMLAGGEDGSVSVWDLRKSTYPLNVLNAHKQSVSEIVFHSERPEHLFTCSFSGEVWHWNTSKHLKDFGGDDMSWLSSDAGKHRMEIFSLMPSLSKPINSLDVNRTSLVCGADNEAVYIIKNLLL